MILYLRKLLYANFDSEKSLTHFSLIIENLKLMPMDCWLKSFQLKQRKKNSIFPLQLNWVSQCHKKQPRAHTRPSEHTKIMMFHPLERKKIASQNIDSFPPELRQRGISLSKQGQIVPRWWGRLYTVCFPTHVRWHTLYVSVC